MLKKETNSHHHFSNLMWTCSTKTKENRNQFFFSP